MRKALLRPEIAPARFWEGGAELRVGGRCEEGGDAVEGENEDDCCADFCSGDANQDEDARPYHRADTYHRDIEKSQVAPQCHRDLLSMDGARHLGSCDDLVSV